MIRIIGIFIALVFPIVAALISGVKNSSLEEVVAYQIVASGLVTLFIYAFVKLSDSRAVKVSQ